MGTDCGYSSGGDAPAGQSDREAEDVEADGAEQVFVGHARAAGGGDGQRGAAATRCVRDGELQRPRQALGDGNGGVHEA